MWIILGRVLQWFFLSDRPLKNAALVGGTLFGVQVLLLLGSGYVDGSLFIPGDDLGVFEHAGIWAIICGDWLIYSDSPPTRKKFW